MKRPRHWLRSLNIKLNICLLLLSLHLTHFKEVKGWTTDYEQQEAKALNTKVYRNERDIYKMVSFKELINWKYKTYE